ncbi:MAG: helix-turn-helix domain-containing protein [Melioribacteraceae bacterium]|nr:helix-turn-helix domain-containing protein [Melioribacteraceae bacterium]
MNKIFFNCSEKLNAIFRFNLKLLLLFLISNQVTAQKVFIKNVDKKSLPNASVIIQIYYKPVDYLIHETKEKLFSFVTDTSGTVNLSGEFQKENYKVDSVSFYVQHENYIDKKFVTYEYSKDPKFSYTIYLVNKRNDVKIVSMPSEDKNELDVFTSNEIAKKLKIEENDVIKLIETKKLKGKKIGQKYFISGNDLRKFLEE